VRYHLVIQLGSLELVELEVGDSNDSEDRQHHNLQKDHISSSTVMKVVVAVVVFFYLAMRASFN
jgi:hypothetical protein